MRGGEGGILAGRNALEIIIDTRVLSVPLDVPLTGGDIIIIVSIIVLC